LNGVHDMGGMHGFGQVVIDKDEPVFHSRWEAGVRVLMRQTVGRFYHLDEFRHAIERMPADAYLRARYYERWLHGLETLMLEHGVVTDEELRTGRSAGPAPAPEPGSEPRPKLEALFHPGERVITRNLHPSGHTRLPRYARGKSGVVRTVNGPFLLPDTNAHRLGKQWEACYAVEFTARELWGEEASAVDRVCVDLWESYLRSDRGES
jgi:nitrile hydratase beta subunit